MNCRKAEQWILLRDSGELSARRERALGRHLAWCTACQAQVHALRQLTHATRAWDAGRPGPGTLGAIRTGLIEAADRREAWTVQPARHSFPALAWAYAAVPALLLAGLLWMAVAHRATPPGVASTNQPAAGAGLAWDDSLDAELDALTDLLASSLTDQNGQASGATTELDEDTMARELLELQGYNI
jgi:anti-sigma factor RsiW